MAILTCPTAVAGVVAIMHAAVAVPQQGRHRSLDHLRRLKHEGLGDCRPIRHPDPGLQLTQKLHPNPGGVGGIQEAMRDRQHILTGLDRGRPSGGGRGAAQRPVRAEVLAPSDVATAETVLIRPRDHGWRPQRDEMIIGGTSGVGEDLLQTTPLITIETTGALIFSGVATYTMIDALVAVPTRPVPGEDIVPVQAEAPADDIINGDAQCNGMSLLHAGGETHHLPRNRPRTLKDEGAQTRRKSKREDHLVSKALMGTMIRSDRTAPCHDGGVRNATFGHTACHGRSLFEAPRKVHIRP
jgi:hypothetical protein